MSVPAPHFLLFSEAPLAVCRDQAASSAGHASSSGWRFALQRESGDTALEASDDEPEASPERLELLAIVRGLEALDQPSRVTLVTASRSVQRGLSFGLAQWRENDWHWERYGRMTPVKNGDLWQRLDRLLEIHSVKCRPSRSASADDLAPPPRRALGRGRTLRVDPAEKNRRTKEPKNQRGGESAVSAGLWSFGSLVRRFLGL